MENLIKEDIDRINELMRLVFIALPLIIFSIIYMFLIYKFSKEAAIK